MVQRRVYDGNGHVHFVTFSCYKRRKLLAPDQAKRIVLGELGSRLRQLGGLCLGFVDMPEHVHALVWFPATGQISGFMSQWKTRTSLALKALYRRHFPSYWSRIDVSEPVWQARYYGFNVWTRRKVEEKLAYMHENPVKAGFVERAVDWKWSSARWYILGRSVGLPIGWPPGLDVDDD